MRKTLDEVLETLRRLESRLRSRYHVRRIGVFGSVARGEAREDSDVDLFVELERPLGLDFVLLGDEIEEAMGVRVDLADREMLSKLWPLVQGDIVYA